MNRISKSILLLAAIALCGLVSSPAAWADWSEDFNGDTLQNTWFFGSTAGDGNPSPTFLPNDQINNYPDAIVNGRLQMSDSNAVAAGGAANGFGVVATEVFTDVRYTGIINPNGNANSSDTVALLARGNVFSGKFYAAEISFEDGQLIIFRNDDLDGNAMDLDSVDIGVTNSDSVYVDFQILGQTISARAFDAPGGNELGFVTAVDNSDNKITEAGFSGVLGFFAGDVNKPFLAEYDDLNSMVIPEPTSAVLALMALSAAWVSRRQHG